jgi:hypothetical protein
LDFGGLKTMKRSRSLEALFATLLVGCGPQVEFDEDETGGDGSGSDGSGTSEGSSATTVSTSVGTTASTTVGTTASTSATTATTVDDSDTSFDEGPGCDNTIYVDVYDVQMSALEGMLDRNGQVIPDHCWEACAIAGNYEDIVACQLLGVGVTDSGDDGTPPPDGGSTTGGPSTTSPTTGLDTGDTFDSGDSLDTGEVWELLQCEYRYVCLGGRGHASLQSNGHAPAIDPLGRWAAEAAHAEAASVAAFLALHTELSTHGAPSELLDRLLLAARDEVAHARMMTRIAARRGARPRRPRFGPVVVRDLETIAIENAVEGCVRETWAALEASHQARAAVHTDVRAAMRRIAADETRHAELARDIDAWARRRLPRASRARVIAARGVAVRSLERSLHRRRDPELYACAGMPTPATARRLLEGLRAELWAA